MPDCLQQPIIVTVHSTIAIKFDFTLFSKPLKQRTCVGDPGKLTVADLSKILGETRARPCELARAE